MTKSAPAAVLAVAALLSGTAAFATARPRTVGHHAARTVSVTKTHIVAHR